MDETKLRTIAQLQEFLDATPEVSFSGAAGGGDAQRYEHINGGCQVSCRLKWDESG